MYVGLGYPNRASRASSHPRRRDVRLRARAPLYIQPLARVRRLVRRAPLYKPLVRRASPRLPCPLSSVPRCPGQSSLTNNHSPHQAARACHMSLLSCVHCQWQRSRRSVTAPGWDLRLARRLLFLSCLLSLVRHGHRFCLARLFLVFWCMRMRLCLFFRPYSTLPPPLPSLLETVSLLT